LVEAEAPGFCEGFGTTVSLLATGPGSDEKGGALPCALNAADEIAVAAFLERRLPFLGIRK